MKKLEKNKAIEIILFIVIIVLQIISIVYATSKREYYHIDEYYSHGLMQYKRAFIYENEDFLENWHDKEYFKEYLTIDKNDIFNLGSLYKNQAEDVHPPIYYILLRIVCSFNIGEFSIWPGTILNILIFIISSIFLFLISKKIFKNSYLALLVCFVTGFSIAGIETVMYVRMYQLLILNILMLIYWHIKNKDKEKLTYKELIQLYAMVLFGFLTHYYYCIIVSILFVMYLIKCITKKRKVLPYISTIIISALSGIIIFPYSIKHIFFSYRGKEVVGNLFDLGSMFSKICENIKMINYELFHGYGGILILLIGLICLIEIIRKNKKEAHKENNNEILYVIIPLVIYLGIIMVASPYIDLRYIMPAIPLIFCTIIYVLNDILEDIIGKNTIYVILIISVCFAISVIPKLSNNSYTYKGHGATLEYIENNLSKKPLIYVYNVVSAQYNKTMECYEALTKVDKTYIMPTYKCNAENIEKVINQLDRKDGILIMVNGMYKKAILEEINKLEEFSSITEVGKLGRYIILELQ